MLGEFIQIAQRGDARGSLSVLESERSFPFPIKRVYYIYGTQPGVERGFHAHKALNQLAVAVCGSCDMELDDGAKTATLHMDSPSKGVLIGPGIWREMKNFTPDCVLLVFADAYYDESDYIRDYHEFVGLVKNKNFFSE